MYCLIALTLIMDCEIGLSVAVPFLIVSGLGRVKGHFSDRDSQKPEPMMGRVREPYIFVIIVATTDAARLGR